MQFDLPTLVRPRLALAGVVSHPFVGDSLGSPHGVQSDRQLPWQDIGEALRAMRRRARDSWDGEPVAVFGCRLRDLCDLLPTFSPAPLTTPGSVFPNPNLDLIVRMPDQFLAEPVAIAAVSKTYALVQHRDAMAAVRRALHASDIDAENLRVQVTLSEFGRHIACSARLPENYDFEEADGTRMALTIECFNSVDGSSAFRLLAGWFRFICSNGLIIGNTKLNFRRTHRSSFDLRHVQAALERGLHAADVERLRLDRWQRTRVRQPRLIEWCETTIAERWGKLAAARVLHIARTGRDARFETSRWNGPLHQWPMIAEENVPGAPPPADTLYKVLQVLAWLAGQTQEVGGRIKRRSEVLPLVRRLARTAPTNRPTTTLANAFERCR